jgi:DNA-binding HxlR family transcriptional regulator
LQNAIEWAYLASMPASRKGAKRQRRSDCPIACALDLVGDRWTLLIVRDLVLGKTRFEEFLASEEGIATNILAARLKLLEDLGYVARRSDAVDRRRVRYRLTKSGKALRKLVRGIADWGLKNVHRTKLAEGIRK